jgi:hypothetical protein
VIGVGVGVLVGVGDGVSVIGIGVGVTEGVGVAVIPVGVGELVGVTVAVYAGPAEPAPGPTTPPAPTRIRSTLATAISWLDVIATVFIPSRTSPSGTGTASVRQVPAVVSGYGQASECMWPLTTYVRLCGAV